ncbi:MAG: metallophosphoesterase [Candidatus Aminicenantes bacterium]|nr:metallophosphoesterase [Candidatus Aminicenantes bacterium]
MNRILTFVLFILIACSIYFLMHYVVFKVLVKNLTLPARWTKGVKLFFLFSGLSFPAAMFLSRGLKFHLLNHYAFIWLGVIAISFFFSLVSWPVFKIFPGKSRPAATAALILISIISAYSLFNGSRLPAVKKINLSLKNLPREMDGFSIVQLSDLHIESYKSKKVLAHIVAATNALKPGLIVITGDLIEGNILEDSFLVEQLRKLKAVHGVLAVTGNHEFFAGIDNFMALGEKTGITILRNRMIKVADVLQIVGIDDDEAKRSVHTGLDPETLLKACDPQKPVILLYHRPSGFDDAVAKGVDLQLSGHTHAGQIPPMDLLVQLVYKYPAGLYKKKEAYIYTSPGTGYWGPPMRFLNRAEITHIVLKSKK